MGLNPYYDVIVRAFQGEPAHLLAVDTNVSRVAVIRPQSRERYDAGESSPLWLPRQDVFDFDAEACAALEREWRETGATSREKWRALRTFAKIADADFSEEEIARRRDETLRRMLNTPPSPQKKKPE